MKCLNDSTEEEDTTMRAGFRNSERLRGIKTLLWKTLRVVNEPGVSVSHVEEMFTKLGSVCQVADVDDCSRVYYGDLLWNSHN